ncbi:MAG: hypothetical protein OSB10_05445 [Planctomycetota bacterium]|nr:hypothetical protein [Planctomycetota bacterium]
MTTKQPMPEATPRQSLVVPMYNESTRIAFPVRKMSQYLKNMPIVFTITIPVSTLNDYAVERPSIRAGNRICTWLSQRTAGAA